MRVYDWNRVTSRKFIGEAEVPLSDLEAGQKVNFCCCCCVYVAATVLLSLLTAGSTPGWCLFDHVISMFFARWSSGGH